MAARSKEYVCGRSLVGTLGSNFGYLSFVNVVFCIGRGLCEWPSSRSGESFTE